MQCILLKLFEENESSEHVLLYVPQISLNLKGSNNSHPVISKGKISIQWVFLKLIDENKNFKAKFLFILNIF